MATQGKPFTGIHWLVSNEDNCEMGLRKANCNKKKNFNFYGCLMFLITHSGARLHILSIINLFVT